MLAAAYRLRRSNEFAAAVRAGRRAGRGTVVVHLYLPHRTVTDQSPATTGPDSHLTGPRPHPQPARSEEASGLPVRAGFVVSKAVGGAVVRNKVRRRLRHLVAERLGAFPRGTTLVVRALPGAAGVPYRQLGDDLDAAIGAARAPRPARTPRRRG